MKKLLVFLMVSLSSFLNAQETFSISFDQATAQHVINELQTATGKRFYYDSEWLADQPKISGQFKAPTLEQLLSAIFEHGTLNFFIDGDKIILTNNSRIYNHLPDDFFAKEATAKPAIEKPVFYQQFDSSSVKGKRMAAITLIGREQGGTREKYYTLSGYIKNEKSGTTIPNIALRAKGTEINTVSDADGYFTLRLPPGMNQIETESISHYPFLRNVMVYSNGKLDIVLNDRINQLAEVTVRGKKSQQVRTAITGVTTIDAEGIKNLPLLLGERDILRVALALPGIKNAGEGASGYNVRGGKEDQNLFLLDEAPIYNPSHFFGFFAALNPYTTKKADIYKGSIPAEFGGRLSSVFDITSKSGIMDHFNGEAGIGPVTSSISVGVPVIKEKAGFFIGGRAAYSDWILKELDDEQLSQSEAGFYDAILKYTHRINNNNTFEAMGYYSRDRFSISSDSLYRYSNRLFSAHWNHDFNERHKGSMTITNTEYRFNIDFRPDGDNGFDFGYKINESQLLFKLNYELFKKHKFSYGAMAKHYGVRPGSFIPILPNSLLIPVTVQKERGLETALFFSDSFKVSNKFLIDIGLRYSWFGALGAGDERIYEIGQPISEATLTQTKAYGKNEIKASYGGFEPRIAARYFLADDFSIKASFDQTYQYIHQLSSNTTQSPTDTWKLSDGNIKPQRSKQFSLGLYRNLDNDKYELSLEGYYKHSDNILDYKVAADLALNEQIETQLLSGEGKAYGAEFLIKKSVGKLNGWIGYAYSRAMTKLNAASQQDQVNNGNYFAANYDKPHDLSIALNYKFTQRYSFSSNFVYQTGRPITYPVGKYDYGNATYVLYSDRNKFRIPDYYRLDFGVNIEGNHKIKKFAHSFWNISVYNMLGRNNPYSIFFVTKDGQVKAYKTSIFAMPIPTVTYNFKF